MSEMVEQVAKAIAARRGWDLDALTAYGKDKADFFREDARAAIEAMREPTEAMIDQGVGDFPLATTPYRADEYAIAARQIYRAMIFNALCEGLGDDDPSPCPD